MSQAQHDEGVVPEWTLGWRMQRALHYAQLSVEQMAEEIGVSRSTISRWLNDRGSPSRGYIKLWALRTGVSLDWLGGTVQWATESARSSHRLRHLELDLEPEITTQDILALRKQLHGDRRGPVDRRREATR